MRGGSVEQPLAAVVAEFGESRLLKILARHVLRALLSFTGRDDPEGVRALLAHLRADALAHS